ncbi:P27 family phage terminase small subunit [Gordonia sp. CPCC 205515]|uniref:P27 family phage terminase small subunit n=1 Tax=Gordonia sp. CPCC 205515 TaxID=3140791 RepID=UPI003AF33555
MTLSRKDSDDSKADVVRLRPSAGPASGIPARGYSWEPFKANNTAAVKHGAYSERVVVPMAAEIANDLMAKHERLRNPLFRESLQTYSRVAAQVETLERHVAEHGLLNDDGNPTGAAGFLLKVTKQLSNLANELGLTPLANARLGKDTAATQFDLARAWAAQSGDTSADNDSA